MASKDRSPIFPKVSCAGCANGFRLYTTDKASCTCDEGFCQADNDPVVCSRWFCGSCRMWFVPPPDLPVRPAPAARSDLR